MIAELAPLDKAQRKIVRAGALAILFSEQPRARVFAFMPGSLSVPATVWKDHFCEACATEFQKDLDRFRQQETAPFRSGMSEQEREISIQASREARRIHMSEWKSRRLWE